MKNKLAEQILEQLKKEREWSKELYEEALDRCASKNDYDHLLRCKYCIGNLTAYDAIIRMVKRFMEEAEAEEA